MWEIGILLRPEHRRQGAGTAAPRLLVEHHFPTTTAHRIPAGTQSDNVGEQRALEKCGLQREGLLREAVFPGGPWHDSSVRRQLERFRGREIDNAVDGFLATFDGPGRAIECACAIRDAVRALGIEVRAGLHG